MKTNQMIPKLIAVTVATVAFAKGDLQRPLDTDRPDATESPYTVDKGHFQFELEIASYSKDGSKDSYAVSELNFKFGVAEDTDVQLVLPIYEHVVGGPEGFGDIQLRLKRNIWGNDSGDTALAVMPFLQIPTGTGGITSGGIEGGAIVPLGFSTAGKWSYGLQAELDLASDELGSGYHFAFLTSATAAFELTETFGMFLEVVAIFSEGVEASTEAYFNTGMTHAVSETLQLDGGVRIGLTNDSMDFTPFAGVSVKF